MLKVFVQEARTRDKSLLGLCFLPTRRDRTIAVLHCPSSAFVIEIKDELCG